MTSLSKLESTVSKIVEQEQLPPEYAASIHDYFVPLAQSLGDKSKASKRPILVGINGAQGTGKSTLSVVLQQLLLHQSLTAVVISIDDLYLTRKEREILARTVHPLLKTRGVPGTHDIALGLQIIEQLQNAGEQSETFIPRFDKANDDRFAKNQWTSHQGRADVIILEGWCVGAGPWNLNGAPINRLESELDSDGQWRRFIATALQGNYQTLFHSLDVLLMLKAPSMECIIEWRTLQEQKLAQKVGVQFEDSAKPETTGTTRAPNRGVMNKQELLWFIMHYERLTRIMLESLPNCADAVYEIDSHHKIVDVRFAQHHGAVQFEDTHDA